MDPPLETWEDARVAGTYHASFGAQGLRGERVARWRGRRLNGFGVGSGLRIGDAFGLSPGEQAS